MKLILSLSPFDRKVKKSHFFVDCESNRDGISKLEELYPNQFKVIGVSNFIGEDTEFVDKLLF